jgi:GTPase
MKFVDKVAIHVKAGNGGDGSVSFRREKYVPQGGPDGGRGGNGGNVVLEATIKLQTLMDLRIKHNYKAGNGIPGGGRHKSGLNGNDAIIRVPCGTIVFDPSGEKIADLINEGDTFIVASGGNGGRGNKSFASSINRVPYQSQLGLLGEEKDVSLELRMLADVGLIGLPNAGKSTLLKVLTQANPKIAAYPFTTLYPNLGILKFYDQEVVLADIPGLIEGASKGQGLGHDFLRHVDRTRFLFHLISLESNMPEDCWNDYNNIHQELALSEMDLSTKPIVVVLSKVDIINADSLNEIISYFKEKGIHPITISSVAQIGIDELCKVISSKL